MGVLDPPGLTLAKADARYLGNAVPIASPRQNSNVISSYTVLWAESSRSFPAQARPQDPTRIRVVIKNLGSATITVQFGTQASNNYNAPSWTNALTIAPKQEWVTEGSSAPIFIAPPADSTTIIAGIYTELGAL